MQEDLAWEVDLPDRKAGALGGTRPRAKLLIESPSHGSESISIPVRVGRCLSKAQEEGSISCASRSELLYHLREIATKCGRERVEDLINRRDYSSKELEDKLLSDGYSRSVASSLVERAKEVGLIDDVRYAQAFVRSKVLSGWGPRKIEVELERRGIPKAEIEGWPEELFDEDTQREHALALASRRHLTGKNDFARIVRALTSRGFSMRIASDVAREILDAATPHVNKS